MRVSKISSGERERDQLTAYMTGLSQGKQLFRSSLSDEAELFRGHFDDCDCDCDAGASTETIC